MAHVFLNSAKIIRKIAISINAKYFVNGRKFNIHNFIKNDYYMKFSKIKFITELYMIEINENAFIEIK